MKLSLSQYYAVQRASAVSRVLAEASQQAFHARGGTWLDKALAVGAVTARAVWTFIPPLARVLQDSGYKLMRGPLGKFYEDVLQELPPESTLSDDEDGGTDRWWVWKCGHDVPVVMMRLGDEEDYSPSAQVWVLAEKEELFFDLLRQSLWARGNSLRVFSVETAGRRKCHVVPWGDSGVPYVGDPPLRWYSDRIARYSGMNRTVQLEGPSGVGKSTLARELGRALKGPQARTLKVSSSTLEVLGGEMITALAGLMLPDVYVIDDYRSQDRGGASEQELSDLELLHNLVPLTILTTMTEYSADTKIRKGVGLRPGRVDEIFYLAAPSRESRRELLVYFATGRGKEGTLFIPEHVMGCILDQTEGWTGAYLAELVLRLRVHGIEDYQVELDGVNGGDRTSRDGDDELD